MHTDTVPVETVFVARQPVFRADDTVWGYELLFRSSHENIAHIQDASHATSSVIADGLAMALDGAPPNARILINFPEQLLVDDQGFAVPKERCIIEVLEDVRPSKTTLRAVRKLKEAGYTIAVDDYFGQPELKPFLDLADIVKIDVLEFGDKIDKIKATIDQLPSTVRLLAEKVEDNETYHQLQAMGFELFQGFFFSRPEIIPGRKLSTNETTKLQLLSELAKEDFEPGRLAEILQADPSLTYRLLRYINSVGLGVRQKISSSKRAIDMMGLVRAKQWLRSAIIADLNPTPKANELAYLAVHRAKFLESICTRTNRSVCEPDKLFMTGLFSLLDAMLSMDMAEVLRLLPLEEDVVSALNGTGELRDLLALAINYELGHTAENEPYFAKLELSPMEAEITYIQARNWAQQMLGYSTKEE